jgi:hypothetical protein
MEFLNSIKLPSPERRLRKVALAKGYRVRKVRSGTDQGRYLLMVADINIAKKSGALAHPNSFSLDELKAYLKA